MPEYAAKILSLQEQLKDEREVVQALCENLENPANLGRWRPLGGDDPDAEQLAAKALSDKLRAQANSGREDTLALAKKVNEFQARIKEVTRKMMATVSEPSMYQATALKLQQEKHDRDMELEEAQWRLEQGQAPTEEIEHAWYRSERDRLRPGLHRMNGRKS